MGRFRCWLRQIPAAGDELRTQRVNPSLPVGTWELDGPDPHRTNTNILGCCGMSGCSKTFLSQGCDPFAQTQRSKLQHRRARINQQINKEMRMRAGAENLFR